MNCFVLKALKLQIIANCCHATCIIVSNCCNFRVIVEITENCLFVIRQHLGKPLSTVLQELSKCEVKAWLCWNLIIIPLLRFYVKSNFGDFKRSKNVIFGNFRDSEFWIWLNLGLESCSNLLKSKFKVSEIAKNDIFGPFESSKIGFRVKSEWRYYDQILKKSSLNFTFW